MSLDPKDLRLKLERDIHAGLDALADVDGVGLADYAQRVLEEHVLRRVHAATVIADRVGALGHFRDSRGKSGKGRE